MKSMTLQRCLAIIITCFSSSCIAVRCGSFSGFHAGLQTNVPLANASSVLKGYTSLKDGIFAVDITVAVLSGEVTVKYSGVYFLSTTVHFSAAPNDTCDGRGTVKVAICVDSDCNNNASLQAISQTRDTEFSMTATGLLYLTTPQQVVRVHLSNSGNSSLIIGAASTFSGYLLAC
ncbi:hypothetical protein EMCRGX_G017358 [Ephydatia muelleri]